MVSPEGSEYVVSDNSSNNSMIYLESSNKSNKLGGDELSGKVVSSVKIVKTLQKLYLVFLPSYVSLEDSKADNEQNKCKKTKNRKAVYTGESRTSVWQRESQLRHGAANSMTLDEWVVKTLCQVHPSSPQ
jgi:hypothetical protein